MDRMLVIVFDTESKAYEGKEALLTLDDDGRISVYACVVISKNADGSAEVEQAVDSGPLGTLIGTSLGSFIGLLGGPTGLASNRRFTCRQYRGLGQRQSWRRFCCGCNQGTAAKPVRRSRGS